MRRQTEAQQESRVQEKCVTQEEKQLALGQGKRQDRQPCAPKAPFLDPLPAARPN
jgi:hypothetical protein